MLQAAYCFKDAGTGSFDPTSVCWLKKYNKWSSYYQWDTQLCSHNQVGIWMLFLLHLHTQRLLLCEGHIKIERTWFAFWVSEKGMYSTYMKGEIILPVVEQHWLSRDRQTVVLFRFSKLSQSASSYWYLSQNYCYSEFNSGTLGCHFQKSNQILNNINADDPTSSNSFLLHRAFICEWTDRSACTAAVQQLSFSRQ